MKFKKKLWISLILFILFGTVFSGWIFHQNTTREHLVFDNTTQLVTTERPEDNIRIEDVILPDSFQNQQSILFKTTHTRAEVLLDGEKIYEFGNDTDTLRFMKSPGSCWHIVDLPKNSETLAGQDYSCIFRLLRKFFPSFWRDKRRLYPEDPEQQSLFIGSKLRNLIVRNHLPDFMLFYNEEK